MRGSNFPLFYQLSIGVNMQEFTKLELEVQNPQGIIRRFTCDMTTEWVWKGGKNLPVACPWLVDFDSNHELLDNFTGYRGTFEVIHYNVLEGGFFTGELESSNDEVLATWKFLIDGKPASTKKLESFPRYTVS
jgi:hypothetical protein